MMYFISERGICHFDERDEGVNWADDSFTLFAHYRKEIVNNTGIPNLETKESKQCKNARCNLLTHDLGMALCNIYC